MQATDLVSHTHNNLMYVRTYMLNTISMVDRYTSLKLGEAEYEHVPVATVSDRDNTFFVYYCIHSCGFNGGDTYVSMREDCGCGRGCNLACV